MMKKGTQKALSCLMAVMLIMLSVVVAPLEISAETTSPIIASGTCGDNLTWTLDDDGTLTISGMGDTWDYDYNSQPWSDFRDRITAVQINSGVTSIGWGAFYDCDALKSIVIPESVTSIGSNAFSSCNWLRNIVIPESVTSIGSKAFSGCSRLMSILIPDSVTSIGERAFFGTAYYYNTENWIGNVLYINNHLIEANTSLSGIYTIRNGTKTIAYGAFAYCVSLTSIVITESVTSIGGCAFKDCRGLTSIVIPDGVTSIGERAFLGSNSLTSIVIPDSVTSIGDCAFFGCSSLTSIVIPDGVTSIANEVFSGCGSLTSIVIPHSVTSIGDWAFCECRSLTSIVIPDGVISIGNGSFYYCSALTSIEIPDGVTSIGDYAFYYCSALTSIKIPDGVTSIGDYAFYYCGALTSIEIPDGVTSIGDDAFAYCSALMNVVIPEGVTSIGSSAFYNCSSLVVVVAAEKAPSGWSDYWANFVSHVHWGVGVIEADGVNYILRKDGTASVCRCIADVDKVVIPSEVSGYAVTEIESSAFASRYVLTSITIPDSVTRIGNYAFHGTAYYNNTENWTEDVLYINNRLIEAKTSLSGIYTIRNGTKTIADAAFRDCSSLTSIEIPDSVTSIGDWAFEDCSSLTSIEIPDSVASIGDSVFYGCSSLTSIEIPDSVTSIGYRAFRWCSSLTSIEIPSSVTSIGGWAFDGCNALTSITIPDSVTSIGSSAFNCTEYYDNTENWIGGVLYINNHLIKAETSLSGTFTIRNGTKTIAGEAFHNCYRLTSIEIPNGVTSIGDGTFGSCSSLKSITIPDSVTSIGYCAFTFCSSLTSITIPSSVTSIGDSVFYSCSSLTSIVIPDSVTSIESSAFKDCSALTIYGNSGSYAATYANENKISFTVINPCENDGHTYGEWTIVIEPTCTEKGNEKCECTREGCEASETREVEALGHDYGEWMTVKQPTCTENGGEKRMCTHEGCNSSEMRVVKAIGHDYGEFTVDVEPTDTKPGIKSHHCSRCEAISDVTPVAPLKKPEERFKDVKRESWYYAAVDYALTYSLFNGMSDTEFAPNTPMTRAMLVQVLYNLEKKPNVDQYENKFTDVKDGQWYTNAIKWASNNGIVYGTTETKFSPQAGITREQLSTILFRYAKWKEYDVTAQSELSSFPDEEKVSSYATDAIKWAVGAGLISGNKINGTTMLDPKGAATRAQVALILKNFCEKVVG